MKFVEITLPFEHDIEPWNYSGRVPRSSKSSTQSAITHRACFASVAETFQTVEVARIPLLIGEAFIGRDHAKLL